MPQPCVVGVDLGGTNVRAAAYNPDGSEAGPKFTNPSHAQAGLEAVVEAVLSTINQARRASSSEVRSVGLAIPGHIDDSAGLVRWAPNFGFQRDGEFEVWQDVPLKALVQARLEVPVHTGNDANLAALGEYRYGVGRGTARCMVMITLGTGIGGGVVISPEAVQGDARGPLILVGGNKGGAELGHVCINRDGPDVGAVMYGALESYCGKRAILNRVEHKLRYGRASRLKGLPELTPLLLAQAAAAGDEVAIEVWTEVGEYLGNALGSFINVFAPDVIAIGGQIAKVGEVLLGPARRAARNVAIPTLLRDANIVQAERVEDAGTLGAAALAWEMSK